jgi:hypothetical protein
MPEKNGNGGGKLTLTLTAGGIVAILGALGLMLKDAIRPSHSLAAAETVEDDASFIRLNAAFGTHCVQQEKDCLSQRERDSTQDRRVDSVSAGVDMLNQGVVRIETNTEQLQRQMGEVQSDIKKLLEQRRP